MFQDEAQQEYPLFRGQYTAIQEAPCYLCKTLLYVKIKHKMAETVTEEIQTRVEQVQEVSALVEEKSVVAIVQQSEVAVDLIVEKVGEVAAQVEEKVDAVVEKVSDVAEKVGIPPELAAKIEEILKKQIDVLQERLEKLLTDLLKGKAAELQTRAVAEVSSLFSSFCLPRK
jgi:ABC-type Zn uptake system ZnuABC Zn-binding protein ZnuA